MSKRSRKIQDTAGSPERRPGRTRSAPRGSGWLLVLILILGIALRTGYFVERTHAPDYDSPLSDAQYNDFWARGLTTGDWSVKEGLPDPEIQTTPYFRPPGYPYFLAGIYRLCGGSYAGPVLVQMLLGLASCVLLYRLGRALLHPTAGLIAAAGLALYWSSIYYEGELQPPALLVFLILAAMSGLLRWLEKPGFVIATLGGLALGWFTIARPNLLLFLPLVVIWMVWTQRTRMGWRRAIVHAGTLLGVVVLVIVPVTVRNYRVGDDFVLISSNGGINLYIGNNPDTSLVVPRIPEIEQLAGSGSWSLFTYPKIARGVATLTGSPDMQASDVSKYFSDRAWAYIHENPGKTIVNALRRGLLLWGPYEVSNEKVPHYERANSNFLWLLPGFPLAASGFVLGLILWLLRRPTTATAAETKSREREDGSAPSDRARSRAVLVLVLLFIGVYTASFMPFLAAGRFRVPIIPFLMLFAGYAGWQVLARLQSRHYRALAFVAVGWAALYGVASVSWVEYKPNLGQWHLDRAAALAQKGDLLRARPEYEAAIKADPGFPDSYASYGGLLVTLGEFDQAIETYRAGLKLNPRFAELRRTLADLLLSLDMNEEAAQEYRAALEVSPDNAQAWYDLGRVLARLDRTEEAAEAYRKALEVEPKLVEARVNLGVLLQSSGDLAGAEREFRGALEINPNMFEAYFNLASVQSAQRKYDEAIRSLSAALHIRPDHPEAQRQLQGLREYRRRQKEEGAKDKPSP